MTETRPFNDLAGFSIVFLGAAVAGIVVGFVRVDPSVIFRATTAFGLLACVTGTASWIAIVRSKYKSRGYACAVTGMLLGFVAIFFGLSFGVSTVAHAAERSRSQNNLRSLGHSLVYLADEEKALPGPAITDAQGRPLLSWRVAVLPYLDLEERELYREFKLDEPWDSTHNIRLLPRMPSVFRAPRNSQRDEFTTYYRVFVGAGTAFERPGLRLKKDFPDGIETTIMIIEAGDAVPWTKPDELEYSADRPLPALGGVFTGFSRLERMRRHQEVINAIMMDGSVRWFDRNTDETKLRALITRNGGEEVELP